MIEVVKESIVVPTVKTVTQGQRFISSNALYLVEHHLGIPGRVTVAAYVGLDHKPFYEPQKRLW